MTPEEVMAAKWPWEDDDDDSEEADMIPQGMTPEQANEDARVRAATQVEQAGRGLGLAMKKLLTDPKTPPTLETIAILATVQQYVADATCCLTQRLDESRPAPEAPSRLLVPGGLVVPR